MNQQLQTLLRALLSAVGAYILGRNIFGTTIDASVWQEFTGSAMGFIAMVWSVYDKSATIESIMGVVRQIITFVGGLMVSKGTISVDTLTMILGLLAAALPYLQSHLSIIKNNQLDNGTITVGQLKK